MNDCPCGSGLDYANCCEPIIKGTKQAETAEQLMRSRYSAYSKAEIDHIINSTAIDQRKNIDKKSTKKWAERSIWNGLEIIKKEKGGPDDVKGKVEFIAYYTEKNIRKKYHELSTFRKARGKWFFIDGEPVIPAQIVNNGPKIGRNDPCFCGSGKKYKKCCLKS